MKPKILNYEDLFYFALRIRLIEEKIVELYPSDKIVSPVHLSIGQEHHTVAIIKALSCSDKVFTTYRSHAVYLAKNGNLPLMMAELYGKQGGISKGKAGSMHLCSPNEGMMGSSAIVGAVFPHAIGLAYSQKISKESNNITLCITGEGATEEGVFYETLNFASLKKVPLIYIVENNGLAINSPVSLRQSYTLKKLANAYNIEYFSYKDGTDMINIHKSFSALLKNMRDAPRPIIIEINTYRYFEHVGINIDYDNDYRDKAEYNKWRRKDPLLIDEKLKEKYTPKILKEIENAVLFADASPFPSSEELFKDVY